MHAPRQEAEAAQASLWEITGHLGGSSPTRLSRPLIRPVTPDTEPKRPAEPELHHCPPERVERHPDLVLLLSVEEVARALRLGRSKTYELIASGELETVHIGRSVRVPVDVIERFVEGLRRPGAG